MDNSNLEKPVKNKQNIWQITLTIILYLLVGVFFIAGIVLRQLIMIFEEPLGIFVYHFLIGGMVICFIGAIGLGTRSVVKGSVFEKERIFKISLVMGLYGLLGIIPAGFGFLVGEIELLFVLLFVPLISLSFFGTTYFWFKYWCKKLEFK